MRSTILNTSKELTGFSDFPPPKAAANFMRNTEVYDYLEAYARHFDLEKHIRFCTEVNEVRRADDYQSTGNWIVVSKEYVTLMLPYNVDCGKSLYADLEYYLFDLVGK